MVWGFTRHGIPARSPRRSFVLAADRFLAGFLDPREILRVRTANTYGVAHAIAEAVRQFDVVDDSLPALSLGAREVLVGGHPVTQFGSDRFEIASASKLLGAEAFGHLACEFRDVTLLGCLDEDSLHAERLQISGRLATLPSAQLRLAIRQNSSKQRGRGGP
jgi:hypothetical protein